MPLGFGLWRVDGKATRLNPARLQQESRLEDAIAADVGLVDDQLLIIGRQVATDYGKLIDLLAVDPDGDLVIIEVKRDRTPREVVAQILDYAAWITSLTYERITRIHDVYRDQCALPAMPFETAFEEAFGETPPDALNESHRLLVAASKLDDATERIITYLSEIYAVPINAAFFQYFQDGPNEYLARAWLIDPTGTDEAKASPRAGQKARQPWNGRDFYVSFGETETRQWEDARRFGYVSGGGGPWYIRTLAQLTPGKRVFVHVPQVGYVGVGIVTESVQPLDEFYVDVEGQRTRIDEAPLRAPNVRQHADDPEKIEHFVRVEWIETLPKEQAIWERGFFANQNTVAKLRNRFTLDTLIQRFGLDE